MADIYVDLTGSGSATSPYDTWAKAESTLQTALETHASAGDRIFIKTSATNTDNKEISSADVVYTSPGTITNPVEVYGCKSGTTNEPPVTADLTVKGDADAPYIESNGAAIDLGFAGAAQYYGIEFHAGNRIQIGWSTDTHVWAEQCLFVVSEDTTAGYLVVGGNSHVLSSYLRLINSDVELPAVGAHIRGLQPGEFHWLGGLLVAGSGTTVLFDGGNGDIVRLIGVDLTAMGSSKTLFDAGNSPSMQNILLQNCELPASLTLWSGTPGSKSTQLKVHNCSTSTGISTSVIALHEENSAGTVDEETTRIRTDGATDGAAGGFSLAMQPKANAVQFPNNTLSFSLPIAIWLDGTETTVTVYIANDSASTDMQDDEVWLEVWASDSTLDTAQYVLDSDRMALLGTPANQTDDTGSTWGSGANNPQTLAVTIAPGYEGWALCYVHCAERAASPKTVYVDPLPVLS